MRPGCKFGSEYKDLGCRGIRRSYSFGWVLFSDALKEVTLLTYELTVI